jgi:type IV pilus assembly protein PilZ
MAKKIATRVKPSGHRPDPGRDQRRDARVPLKARVDFELTSEDTFLFEYTSNVSRGGIFLSTRNPLPVGAVLTVKFALPEAGSRLIAVRGRVIWINEYKPGGRNLNPGMGIEFIDLSEENKEAISRLVRRKALLIED